MDFVFLDIANDLKTERPAEPHEYKRSGCDRKKFILSRREEDVRYSNEFVSGFQVTASMFRPAGIEPAPGGLD
ncbi:MAG: hypothetical protein EBS96_14350 [Spartobacteria bacterium]|nr:hypothetical protein [Spartobacteria bacterium]